MDAEWFENLYSLIGAVSFFVRNIGQEYYSKPYLLILDFLLPYLYYLYLKKKTGFLFKESYFFVILQVIFFGFVGIYLGIPIILALLGVVWHILAFFVRIFYNFNPYIVPRLVLDLFYDNVLTVFLILLSIMHFFKIRDDYKFFIKRKGKYKYG